MGLLIFVLILGAVYLWFIGSYPRRPESAAFLVGKLYAHRGLHDGNDRVVENSLEAFRLAVEEGYGIELDVQPTRDGRLAVFHDDSLKRLCGRDVRIRDLTWEELEAYPLPDGSRIPLFQEVLDLVAGKVPLIVEIKHYGDAGRNARLALEALKAYAGPYCVESFHPLALWHFRFHAPHVLRGQLASGGKREGEASSLEHFAMKYLLVNWIGRPHFVAYSSASDHNLSVWLHKFLWFRQTLLVAWTIRDQAALDQARRHYQMFIFEGFRPDH